MLKYSSVISLSKQIPCFCTVYFLLYQTLIYLHVLQTSLTFNYSTLYINIGNNKRMSVINLGQDHNQENAKYWCNLRHLLIYFGKDASLKKKQKKLTTY